jgi:CHAT domain-containing protein
VLLVSFADGEMKQVDVSVNAAELRQTLTAFRKQLTSLGNPRRLRASGLVLSVMASLWSVNDASTARLVPLFFEHLKNPNLSKAQALQRAQQPLLADVEYQHPFYWAGFVLIGNWL